jgi:hypothetical protein
VQAVGVIIALVGGAVAYQVYTLDRGAFFRAYLVVFLFYVGLSAGSLGILGLQYVTGGRWGVVIRRALEAGACTLPLMAALFAPIVLGLGDLYSWTNPEIVAHDVVLARKVGYLNERFFSIRAVAYFVVWIVLTILLCRTSRRQDTSPGEAIDRRLQNLGRAVLVLYSLTMTFAAVDWAMSIDSHWFSHIYGVRVIGGQILAAFAFAVIVSVAFSRREPLRALVSPARLHDLGNLMLAFVMLWAYFELSQFLIIWSGNLPEEVTFYAARSAGGWQFFSVVLVVLQFVVPFVVLLSRPAKRNPGTLVAVATLILAVRCADVYWQIVPTLQAGIALHWVFAVLLAAMGGLWVSVFVWRLGARPLLPVSDSSLLRGD